MTKQEILDKVAAHFAIQRRPAITVFGHCVYRGPDGLKCAIGALIPDDLYDPRFEGSPFDELYERRPEILKAISVDPLDTEFLIELQCAHDETQSMPHPLVDFLPNLRKNLLGVAKRYRLDPSSLEALK